MIVITDTKKIDPVKPDICYIKVGCETVEIKGRGFVVKEPNGIGYKDRTFFIGMTKEVEHELKPLFDAFEEQENVIKKLLVERSQDRAMLWDFDKELTYLKGQR